MDSKMKEKNSNFIYFYENIQKSIEFYSKGDKRYRNNYN